MVQLTEPPNNFRVANIYPTQAELLGSQSYFRKNIVDGSFESVDEYLDIQFRLLREDFVANLREVLESYRSNERTNKIDIYQNVNIIKGRTRSNEECLKIETNIQTDDSKKFMNGSLLLFTKNNFASLFLAKVVRRHAERQEVIIELIDVNPRNINLEWRYTMAECGNYYDPYFQVLNALQNISPRNFPMERYIVQVDTSCVYMPRYLLYSGSTYQIGNYRFPPEMLPQITTNLLGLNDAQFRAFKAALTQEFVVIQGPPGTGKTHLGVKIAEALLNNSHLWYRATPMLVISHKNDALDQFLEGLIPITQKLVRVGSQSKSEKLKKFNLTNEIVGSTVRRRPKEEYLTVMRNALVVGMTTSVAARWKSSLERLKSPIVIVEEAAEVLEAHVVAALTNSCQHLILLGDHQQLQPIPADHNVGKKYLLKVSLFERMVRNRIQNYRLDIQHRMRPEIANLLKKDIYPFLKDHESVHGRPSVLGVEKNLFFVDHNHPEEVCNLTTRKNKHEAKFLVAFARYLVQNGHKTSEIVILATYTGQIQELEALAKNQPHLRGVKISTLDGFQGQEADIVLLSLVRSDGIGFLAEANRICVALSRARNGFYIVGNMKLLSRSSELWYNIQRCLKSQNSIGRALALRCQTHQTITEVESPDDFSLVQSGGCCKTCRATLPCGHVCFLVCHTNRAAHLCENKCKPFVGQLQQRSVVHQPLLCWFFRVFRVIMDLFNTIVDYFN